MPDFAEDQKGKIQLPKLPWQPWLVKNTELLAVLVKCRTNFSPHWCCNTVCVLIQPLLQLLLARLSGSKPRSWGRCSFQSTVDKRSRIWWQQCFPHSQIFTGLDDTVIWIPATKLQTWTAWTRSRHLMSLPGLFSFASRETFLENCSLNTTTVFKAPEV